MSIKQALFTAPTARYRKALGYTHLVIAAVSLLLLYVYPGSGGLFVIGVSSFGAATVYLTKKDTQAASVER